MWHKLPFWLFVAIDLAVLGLWFVLALAAAGPSKTSPLAVVGLILLLPGALLAAAVWLHLRTQAPGLQLLAYLIVSAPVMTFVVLRFTAAAQLAANPGGRWGETALTRALRELPHDPTRLATLRTLLANGADPDEAGEEQPLVLAIYGAREFGLEPLQLMLAHGADPNHRDCFGRPCWFAATGITVDLQVLRTLLDHGADLQALARDGRGAAWYAVDCGNWPAALLLVQRGCALGSRSPMGMTFHDALEAHLRQHPDDTAAANVLAAARERK